MATLSRRALFALPLAVPAVAVTGCLPSIAKTADLRTLSVAVEPIEWLAVGRIEDSRVWRASDGYFHDWCFLDDGGNDWSNADVARTLGIPYDEPPTFTDADLAATLGIDPQPETEGA